MEGVDEGAAEQRQFFMSKSSFLSVQAVGQISSKKRRQGTAVFVEREPKKTRPTSLPSGDALIGTGTTSGSLQQPLPTKATASIVPQETQHAFASIQPQASQEEIGPAKGGLESAAAEEPRKFKRAGRVVRDHPRPAGGSIAAAAPLPEYHDNMEKLASEMGAWTMDEIQRNLDKLESKSNRAQPPTPLQEQRQGPVKKKAVSRSTLSLRPKVPAQRYAERHPETMAPVGPPTASSAGAAVGKKIDASLDTEMDVDGDWIEEIYQRVPASKLDATVPRSNVGVIVFEDEKEQQFFYGSGEGDSDAEMWQDEEDENGTLALKGGKEEGEGGEMPTHHPCQEQTGSQHTSKSNNMGYNIAHKFTDIPSL